MGRYEEEKDELLLGRYGYLFMKKREKGLTDEEEEELRTYIKEEEEREKENDVGIHQTQWGWM